MVKEKDTSSDYWKILAVKGRNECEIKKKFNKLLKYYYSNSFEKEIFKKCSDEFSESFCSDLNEKLNDIFENKILSQKEFRKRVELFKSKLRNDLTLILKEKCYCMIKFHTYPLYQFLLAFSSIFKENTLEIKKKQIKIKAMDADKIVFLKLCILNKSYKFFREANVRLDIKKLADILKCQKEDNSETIIMIFEQKIEILMNSGKYHSEIKRRLPALKLDKDKEQFKLRNLDRIEYFSSFSMTIDMYEHLLRNIELFSEFIQIILNERGVMFKEISDDKKNDIFWKQNLLTSLEFNLESIFRILNSNNQIEKSQVLKEILRKKECSSAHSIKFFKLIGKLIKPLKKSEKIVFKIRNNHPIRVKIDFVELGQTNMVLYHSPIAKLIEN